MTDEERRLPRLSVILMSVAPIVLMAIGCMAINVCQQAEGESGYAIKQMVYCVVGLIAMYSMALFPYQKLGRNAYVIYGGTLLMLVLVFFLPEVRGSHRWVNLGIIKLQPSEIAKLSMVLVLAWYLRLGDHYRKLIGLVPIFIMTLVPMGLILLEPDLGTCLLFLPTLYVMLFMAGAKLVHLFGIVFVATVCISVPVPQGEGDMTKKEIEVRETLCYWESGEEGDRTFVSPALLAFMKYHQLQRIDGFIRQDDSDIIRGNGYHLYHSKTVLGSGKLTGSGNWDKAQVYFQSLPDDHTDFIFSIICGQWGFICCLIIFLLYGTIVVLGAVTAISTYDPFGRLLAIGLVGLLVTQMFINTGMTIGLMPITGMTLPFVSYGGSSLVINCAAVGMLMSISSRRPLLISRTPFEHDEDTSPVPLSPLEVSVNKERNGKTM